MITADFVGAPRDAVSPNRLRLFIAAAGAAMACLGLVVIVGWHVGSTVLIRLLPSLAAMQHATALGFLAAGLSLVFYARGHRVAGAVLAALVAALGAATLLHYDAGMDLGPLKAMLVPDLEAGALHPGRTGTGTALAFLLSGAALMMCVIHRPDRRCAGAVGILGSVVLGLGVVALSGYVVKPGSPHGWSEFTQMALHTSVGVVALGCALLALAWHGHAQVSAAAPRWLAVAAGVGALTVVVAIWHSLLAEDTRHMRTRLDLAVEDIADHLSTELRGNTLALERMARRWAGDGVEAREAWAADARSYIDHQPAYHALVWIDQEYRFRWVEGAESAGRMRGARFGPDTALGQILAAVKNQDRPSPRWMADLPAGGPGVLLAVPLRDGGEFHGFMAGFLRFPDFVDNTVRHPETAGNTVVLHDGQDEIYRHEGIGVEAVSAWRGEAAIDSHGLAWRTTMLPGAEMLGQLHGTVANILVAVGAALSVVLGLSVHFAQTAARRAHVVEAAHRELKENIRERMAAEGAAARLGHILDHSFNEIYLFDVDSLRFIQVNQGAQRNLGYSMDELRDMTPVDIKPEFDHAQFADLIAPLRDNTEDQVVFETTHGRKDGTHYPIEARLQLSRSGARPVFAAIIQDITARRRSQETLRESERRYRNLIEDSALGVVVHRDGRALFANRAAAQMLGHESPADLLAVEDIQSWVAPEDRALAIGYAEARMRGEEAPTDYEVRAIRKDGSVAWLRYQVVVVTWDGEPAIQTHWTDVTEQKQAEERAKRAQDRLIDAIESLPVAFILYDSEERGVLTNSLYDKWFPGTVDLVKRGASVEEMIQRNVETGAVRWNDDDIEAYARERLAHFRRAEGANIVSYSDGRIFQTIDRKTADGGTVGIRVDVSELMSREAELRDSEARLKTFADNLPGGLYRRVLHPDGGITYPYISDGFRQTFDLDPDRLMADPAYGFESIHPEDREPARLAMEESARTLENYDSESRFIGDSGGTKWYRSIAKPQRLDNGDIAWDGIVVDITEQKRAQAALKFSEERFKDFAEAASDWFWETDSEHRFTGFSGQADAAIAESERRNLGKTRFDNRMADDKDDANWDAHRADMDARRPFKDFQFPLHTEAGKKHYIRVSGRPVFDDGGAFLGYRGTARDDTEIVEAEYRAQEAQQRLAVSIEALSEQFILFDADDRLVLGNKAWRDFNREIEEFTRPGTSYIDFLHAALRAGQYPAVEGRAEEWLRRRLMERQNPSGPHEIESSKNRWIRYNDQRLPDGGVATILTDITEIKQREAALRESKEQFRDFAETASDWFWETDAEHCFTFFSDNLRQIMGANAEDAIGRTRFEIVGSDVERDSELWRNHRDDLDARRRFSDLAYALTDGHGAVRHLRVSGKPVFLENGEFAGYRGTGSDVTAEVAAKTRADEAHARLFDAIESIEEGFALFDNNDNLALTNSRWLDHFSAIRDTFQIGVSFAEIQNRVVASGAIVEARGREQAWVRERIEQHRNPGQPIERQMSDDRWLMISERRTSDGGTVVVTTDITALKERETALRESEARLRRAITDAPIPIMLHAEGGEVLLISREWTEITGYAPSDIPAVDDWLRKAHQGRQEERRASIDALYDLDATMHGGEFDIDTQSGETRVWDFSNAPMGAMPDGRRIVVSMAIDVTERKVAEAEIKELNEGLEKRVDERTLELRAAQGELVKKERLATLGQLTATVSHELRNPLAAMRASAHVIGVALNDNQNRARRAVQRIDRGIVRCDHIIDELLDFTRIRDLDLTATFLDEWLDEVIGEQETPERVHVVRERGLSGATAMIDADRLRRAVINVFDNACQAVTENEDDFGDHCLTVRTHQSDRWIEIEFHDDGPGILPDVEAKIFEPLFSTKGFGVGLGLPVVKQIMEQHGGTVEVETEPGHGTRVRLRLQCLNKSEQRSRTES